jgi:hypothetical protein
VRFLIYQLRYPSVSLAALVDLANLGVLVAIGPVQAKQGALLLVVEVGIAVATVNNP